MPGISDFIKQNVKESTSGVIGKGFIAFDLANIVTGEEKLKSVLKLLRDIVLFKPMMAAAFVGLFMGMRKAITSLVHDTGSLEAALRKLAQIQGLNKIFAGITGGAAAAKMKVAELVNFAASKNIKLGDAAEAARSLMLMTKNSFASAKALDTVNDAAVATGNSVVGVADAVGEFYDTLANGQPIDEVTDKLRQMGVINDDTAASLLRMQHNGATAGATFSALTGAMGAFNGAAAEALNTVEGVNAAFEKAAANLQQKFGSAFVEEDVRNTKNYAAAMNAVAPAVQRVGKFLHFVFGGMSALKSEAIKIATSWAPVRAVLEGVVYILGSLVAIAGVLGTLSIFRFFTALGASLTAMTHSAIVASTAMRWLSATLQFFGVSTATATIWVGRLSTALAGLKGSMVALGRAIPLLLIGTLLASAVQKIVNMIDAYGEKTLDLIRGQNDVNEKIRQQILHAHSLVSAHKAIVDVLVEEAAAVRNLAEAEASGDADRIANAESALTQLRSKKRKVINRSPDSYAETDEERAKTARDVQRGRDEKEARFQAKLALATPAQRAALQAEHLEETKGRARRGARSEEAAATFAREKKVADTKVARWEGEANVQAAEIKRLTDLRDKKLKRVAFKGTGQVAPTDPSAPDLMATQAELEAAIRKKEFVEDQAAQAREAQKIVSGKAPLGSTEEIRGRMAALDADTKKSPEQKARELYYLNRELDHALIEEKEAGEKKLQEIEEAGALAALKREQRLQQMGIEREEEMAAARLKGDNKAIQRLEDTEVFIEKYHQLRDAGVDEPEAVKRANKFAETAIGINTAQAQRDLSSATVADSLTRIGGGGGVYAPGLGSDPMLSAAQRSNELHEEEVEYLKEIAEAYAQGVM